MGGREGSKSGGDEIFENVPAIDTKYVIYIAGYFQTELTLICIFLCMFMCRYYNKEQYHNTRRAVDDQLFKICHSSGS